jgi:Tol biopolymer transport system component
LKKRKLTLLLLLCLLSSCSVQKDNISQAKEMDISSNDRELFRKQPNVKLLVKGSSPAIDPTGKTIAYWGSGANIWAIDTDGKNRRQISNFGWDTSPDWSPDGQKIVFQSYGPQGWNPFSKPQRFSIWVMDRDGKNPYQVEAKSDDSQQYPRWSPDGRHILWSQDNRIWMADANGKNGRPLTLSRGEYQMVKGWSPDGKVLYYNDRHIDLDGQNDRLMSANERKMLQPSDGNYRYDCESGRHIWRIDNKGQKVSVFELAPHGSAQFKGCSISADRKWLLVLNSMVKGGRDTVYLIDLQAK